MRMSSTYKQVEDKPSGLYEPDEGEVAGSIDLEHGGVQNQAVNQNRPVRTILNKEIEPYRSLEDLINEAKPSVEEQNVLDNPAVEKRHERPKGSKNKPKEAPAPAQREYPARSNRGLADRFDEQVFLVKIAEEVNAFLAEVKADPLEPKTYKAALKSQEAAE